MFQKHVHKRLEQSILQAKFDQTLCDEVDKTEADIQPDLEWLFQKIGDLVTTDDQISVCLHYLNHFIETRGTAVIRSWYGVAMSQLGSYSRCVVKQLVPFISTLLEKEPELRGTFFEEGFLFGSVNVKKALISFGHTNTKVSEFSCTLKESSLICRNSSVLWALSSNIPVWNARLMVSNYLWRLFNDKDPSYT